MMFSSFILAMAMSVAPETQLREMIPSLFEKAAAHYKAIDAAATPQIKDEKGNL